MYNLLVSGNGEWWEGDHLSMSVNRFKEYSGAEADAITVDQPETLRRLEGLPALLMYEVGAGGPNARLVRHGQLRNIIRHMGEIRFTFEPDSARAYLDRSVILTFADQLGVHSFEQHRTHWAIKDGNLPPGLLATAVDVRPQRTVSIVAAEYAAAKRERRPREIRDLEAELEGFPPSLEKALALLPARLLDLPTPELYPILGVKPQTPEGRASVDAVLARTTNGQNLHADWFYSVAWFLDLYGSPTEVAVREQAVEACAKHMIRLGSDGDGTPAQIEDVAAALWRCARSTLLVGRLRREIAVVTDRLLKRQDVVGYWSDVEAGAPNVRGTALATVALQRLGDDRHHGSIRSAVVWLMSQRRTQDGVWPRRINDDDADVIATMLSLEAIRRSDMADDVPHVLSAGEAWLVAGQTVLGGWRAEPWSDDFVAAVVLEYLERRGAMLPQVDGFLLMARDFFRKANELRLEGGANNRRLAAIATVHALEMFLYGLFEKREDLSLSPFRENLTETLGPREALRALQESLGRLGLLPVPRKLAHRDQLSSLIGHRDGIIHRAHEISAAELDAGMKHARKFIEKYGADLLSLDLLQ